MGSADLQGQGKPPCDRAANSKASHHLSPTVQGLGDGGAVGHSHTVAAGPASKAVRRETAGHSAGSRHGNARRPARHTVAVITTGQACHSHAHLPTQCTHCALASETATAPGPLALALELATATPLPLAWALELEMAVPPLRASAVEEATAVASSLRAAGWGRVESREVDQVRCQGGRLGTGRGGGTPCCRPHGRARPLLAAHIASRLPTVDRAAAGPSHSPSFSRGWHLAWQPPQ